MKPSDTNVLPVAEEPLESVQEFASGWDRFWFTPSDPTTLGLMRLVSGIVILYSYFCYSFDLLSYVSPREAWLDGPVVKEMHENWPVITFPNHWSGETWFVVSRHSLKALREQGVPNDVLAKLGTLQHKEMGQDEFLAALSDQLNPDDLDAYRNSILKECLGKGQIEVSYGQNSWSIFFHLEQPGWIWTAHLLILFVLFLFTLGLATRLTSVLALLGAICYIWRAQTSLFGMDAIVVVLLFYLMIAPSGAALSVDRWLEVRRARKRLGDRHADIPLQPLVSATFATRLMQVHFCFIYLAAGTSKLLGASWWNGNALWACYANYSFAPMRVGLYMDFLVFLSKHRWLWELFMSGGAFFTLFMELSFPYLVWRKRGRWLMLTGSVLLHTGIGLFMGLATFSLLMLCLVLSFVPPEAARLFLSRVKENVDQVKKIIFGVGVSEPKAMATAR